MGPIYLEACLLIYFIEAHPHYGPRLDARFKTPLLEGFAIPPRVKLECLVGPSRHADAVLHRRYQALFGQMTTLGLPESVYLEAASLRGRFGLKPPEALHLACAQHHRCSELWTDDDRRLRAGRGMARNALA